ncbi:hypothetical protein MMC14_003311 [Varicellaria rhodocarpa]|nr:hypothetical protein [Varicellaria rhodocarpa]
MGYQDIYGHRQGKRQVPKDKNFYRASNEAVQDIVASNDADHARMRRLLSHAFSESALQEQEPLITNYFDLLIRKLHRQIEGPNKGKVDIVKWYNFTTFDLVGDLCFGESFQALKNEDYHTWIVNIFRGIKFSTVFMILKTYPNIESPAFLLLSMFPSLMKARITHYEFTREKLERRLAQKTDRRDFINYIQRHNDEKGMSEPEILATCRTLITAGSETTATLLSGVTFFLLKNPETLRKVTDEVRDAFAARTDINFTSVAQLPYLQACLKEALRLYPPTPSILPRRTAPEGDFVNGRFIPGNISIGVHQWSTHNSERNFKDPQKYVPERWLGDPQYADDDRSAMQPFSIGPRNCLGKNLAYAEMRSILARMLWNFDMELCVESEKWNEQKVFILWDKPPLNIVLKARDMTEG